MVLQVLCLSGFWCFGASLGHQRAVTQQPAVTEQCAAVEAAGVTRLTV